MNSPPETRIQFSLQTLFAVIVATCIVFAACAAPGFYGGASMLVMALTMPGALLVFAWNGGRTAKAFGYAALVPVIFGLYGLAWAFGWTLYSASVPVYLTQWLTDRASIIKVVSLGSWFVGGFAGIACCMLQWIIAHRE